MRQGGVTKLYTYHILSSLLILLLDHLLDHTLHLFLDRIANVSGGRDLRVVRLQLGIERCVVTERQAICARAAKEKKILGNWLGSIRLIL